MAFPTAVNNQSPDAVTDQSIAAINDQITDAIAARHAQIAQLQHEINALQNAASALSGGTTTSAPASTTKTGRKPLSAASRKLLSEKLKAYWAKRNRAKR